MQWVVDRFEEDIVVLENMETQEIENFDKTEFPEDINEGDIVELIDGMWIINQETTASRTQKIKDKFKRLKKRPC